MDASSKPVSPGVIIAAVVVLLLLLAGLWWKFMGAGSATSSGTALNPNAPPASAMQGPAGAPGMPGPGGVQSGPPGGQMPGR